MRSLIGRLDSTLWFIPSVSITLAVALSYVAESVDRSLNAQRSAWFLFSGGPDGARELFSAVASSMLTFSGLVFSITILVLQLASNQFSPRALSTFLKDSTSKLALGVFIGTYVYALLGLRLVRNSGERADLFVPALSAWLAVPLVLLSVGMFIGYLHHIAQSIRAVVVIRRIGAETRQALERLFPEGLGEEPEPQAARFRAVGNAEQQVRSDGRHGIVVRVDEEQLVELAVEQRATIQMHFRIGDFVPGNALLCEVWQGSGECDAADVRRCVDLGPERTIEQDAGFGFRQLVDVAGRALSPGMNDPTTAVEVLDELHDLLRRLVTRKIPSAERVVDDVVRLVLPRPDFSDYLALAVDEIIHWGKDSLQVRNRLRTLLADLRTCAPDHRRGPVLRKIEQLERTLAAD